MDQNNQTANISQGNPVNERDSSFGNNVKGFNQPESNTKGYKPSGEFSKDKSFGPDAPSEDDKGITEAGNFDGHHVNVGTPENNHNGVQPSSAFSFDKDFGTKFTGTEGTEGLSSGMDANKGGTINK